MDDDDDESDDVPVDRRTLRVFATAIRGTAETNRLAIQLEVRMQELREEVAKHRRVLFEGNGKSFATRLEMLERDASERGESTTADRQGRWSVRVAWIGMVTAVGAALATSIAALLAK